MTFGLDQYEKAIARIFDINGHVIGTGFLVAPGFVLTCAHVVLQAIGIKKEAFEDYHEAPQKSITLDFPVLDNERLIEANVVAWMPYSVESGDVAALRLCSPAPNDAQPLPLADVDWTDVSEGLHSVSGFNQRMGTRTDSYRPTGAVAGNRFELRKGKSPDDEKIEGGFSGAPLWNRDHGCIGMVATAAVAKAEERSKAYAIRIRKLQPTLKKVSAHYLQDVLLANLDACDTEEDRDRLRRAIDTTLRQCNPNGSDTPWLSQLIDLATDRPAISGWEAESPLIHFAMMLARLDDISKELYDQLKIWVKRQNNADFQALLDRLTGDLKKKKASATSICEHLMVTVERVETSEQDLRVSLWAISNLEIYHANSLPQSIVQEKVLTLDELPEFIQRQCRQRFGKKTLPIIHLFVPRDLLCCDIEMRPFGKLQEMLGNVYPFVVRINLTVHPVGQWYYDDWQEKWEQIEQALEQHTAELFEEVDCASFSETDRSLPDLMDTLSEQNAAVLRNCESFEELFELLMDEKDSALPVALWSRDSAFESGLLGLLDCVVCALHERIRKERRSAKHSSKKLIGHHLSLVWEDPRVVPPDMQFDPEAC